MHSQLKKLALFFSLLVPLLIAGCTASKKTATDENANIEKTQNNEQAEVLSIGDINSDDSTLSPLSITGLSIVMDETTLFVDQDANVSVKITYEDASTTNSDEDLVFESSDTDLAEITRDGRLTLKQPGEVSIVARVGEASDSITLTIFASALHFVLWITDNKSTMTVFSNESHDLLLTISDEKDCLPVDCEKNTQLTLKPNEETALDGISITTDTRFQITLNDSIHSQLASFVDKKIFSERKYHRAITFKNKLWIIGGRATENGKDRFLSDIWSSPDGNLWTQEALEAAFSGRENHSLSILNDKLILTGGWNDNDKELQDVWESEDGRTFRLLADNAPFPARDSHQTAAINSTLYLMAGWSEENGCDSFNDVWQTQDGKAWTKITENTDFSKRCASAIAVLNDTLYLTGGMEGKDSSRKYLNDAWASTDGENFEKLASNAPFSTRFKHQMVVFNEGLYLSGGFSGNNEMSYFNDVWKSSDGKEWEQVIESASFTSRAGHQMLVKGNWLYILGGYNDQSTFQDVWRSQDGKIFEKRQGGHFSFK
ncbi:MAG: Ig-like domain-containing protein [Cellvibrionales bacterium]|nr:Ig-like domain-containing protein [Cellvibrionales bacterium]